MGGGSLTRRVLIRGLTGISLALVTVNIGPAATDAPDENSIELGPFAHTSIEAAGRRRIDIRVHAAFDTAEDARTFRIGIDRYRVHDAANDAMRDVSYVGDPEEIRSAISTRVRRRLEEMGIAVPRLRIEVLADNLAPHS